MSTSSRRSKSPSLIIGRNLKFDDFSIKSNKRYCWYYGERNIGFLTSEQIDILKEMKRKQKDMRAINHLRPSYENIHKSTSSLQNKQIKTKDRNYDSLFKEDKLDLSTPKSLKQKKKNAKANKKLHNHSRQQVSSSSSQSSNSSRKNVESPKLLKIDSGKSDKNPEKIKQKHSINRRLRTLDIQRINNPEDSKEELNFEVQKSQQSIIQKFKRKLKSRIDIHSKSIDVQVRPQFHSESKKNINNKKITKKSSKDSQELDINKGHIKIQNPVIKKHKANLSTEPEEIPQKKQGSEKRSNVMKVHSRMRFRRDYSPTYCNSFGYPLSCYRYV